MDTPHLASHHGAASLLTGSFSLCVLHAEQQKSSARFEATTDSLNGEEL